MQRNAGLPNIENLDLLLEQVEAGIVIHKPNTEISYANPSALQMLGLTEEEAKGRIADEKDWHFLDSEGNRLTPDLYPVNRVLVSGKPIDNLELGIFDAHRSQPTWVKVAGFPEFNARNELEQIVISFIDISHQRNDISYDQIMSLANDIVVVTNAAPLESPGPDIVSVNHAFSELMGYEPEQVNGKPLSFLKLARLSERTLNEIKARLTNGESYRGRLYAFSKRDQQFWLDINVFPLHNWENRISHFVAIAHDITDIVNREEQLINDALHDPLTGLCNRRGLQARIRQYLKDGNNTANYSLIALDVDRFKQINDHWGHHAGDRVLVEVARIMEDTVRDIDCVARVGGEEFVILLPTMKLETAGQVAERIRERIQNHRIKMNVRDFIMVTASLGVAERAPEDDCIEDTLRKADSALYRAKKSGRNLVESDGSHF